MTLESVTIESLVKAYKAYNQSGDIRHNQDSAIDKAIRVTTAQLFSTWLGELNRFLMISPRLPNASVFKAVSPPYGEAVASAYRLGLKSASSLRADPTLGPDYYPTLQRTHHSATNIMCMIQSVEKALAEPNIDERDLERAIDAPKYEKALENFLLHQGVLHSLSMQAICCREEALLDAALKLNQLQPTDLE